MKKIVNWTFGGFFRSFGRILCYLAIGCLISLIAYKNDIKIGQLFGIGYVNASELQSWSVSQSRIVYDDHGTITYGSFQTTPYTFSSNYPITGLQFRTKASDGLSMQNTYSVQFGFKPNPDAINANEVYIKGENTDKEDITCTPFYRNSNGYYLTTCSFAPRVDYTSNDYLYFRINFNSAYLTDIRSYMYGYDERLGTNAVITNQTNMINNSINDLGDDIANSTTNIINEINNSNQELLDSQKACLFEELNYSKTIESGYLNENGVRQVGDAWGITDYLNIENVNVIRTADYSFIYSCFYKEDKTLISCVKVNVSNINLPNNTYYARFSIRNNNIPYYKVKLCKNGNQALTDTLTDDSMDDSKIKDILDGLPSEDSSSLGPLSSFLLMPLNWVQSLLASNQSCTPLHLPLPFLNNRYLDLPCMTDFWNSMGSLKTLIELVWIAVVCSRVFNMFYKITIEVKDSDPNSYERLTKLKEWEL